MKNLQALNITLASLRGRLHLDEPSHDQLNNALRRYQPDWPDWPITRTDFRHVDNIEHRVALAIETRREIRRGIRSETVLLALSARPSRTDGQLTLDISGEETNESDQIQHIIEDLRALEIRTRLRARIDWIFPPDTKKAIIGLPLMTFQGPNIPLTEVSGVRLRSRTSDGLTTTTIDLREDRSIVTTLTFPWSGSYASNEMLDDAVAQGTDLMGRFLMDLGPDTAMEDQ